MLHAALEYAVRMQILAVNPAATVTAPRLERAEIKVLNEAQTVQLLEAAADTELFMPILIAAYTGLRRGEVLGLRWSDVDFENGRLRVRRALQKTKNGLEFREPKTEESRRVIALSGYLVDRLKEHREAQAERLAALGVDDDDALVCGHGDGQPWNPGSFSGRFGDFVRKSGVPAVTFHGLRHSHTSQLLMQGASLKLVSSRLGHTTIAITADTYGHILEGMDKSAADTFDDALRQAMAVPMGQSQ